MTHYYQIARLTVGRTIFPQETVLRVDLDAVTPGDLIENDTAFRDAAAPDVWFWLSGGGTFLLNGRYIPVVRRSPDARVNPGKFSLFTGRADNAHERAMPALLVRELFEELVLYEGDSLLMPRLVEAQPAIDTAYDALRSAGVITAGPARDLALTPVVLPTRPVSIRKDGVDLVHNLAWTATANNDVNALFLFAAECNIPQLRARDGEFHTDGDVVTPAGRQIYLLDIAQGSARPLSAAGDALVPSSEAMSPSLRFLLSTITGNARP